MGNRSYALLTGAFVVAMGTALVAAAIWLGDTGVQRKPYLVVTQGAVAGLNVQSTVRYRGVNVGKVADIHFDPDNYENILIRIEVDADIPLTTSTYAQLQAQGITGLSRLELRDDEGERGQPLETSEADPAHIPMRPSLIQEAGDVAERLLDDADQILGAINRLLEPASQHRLDQIMNDIEQASQGFLRLQKQIEPAVQTLPEVVDNANQVLKRTDAALADLQGVSGDLERAAEAGESAGETLTGRTLPRLNRLLARLNETTHNVDRLVQELQRHPESLIHGARRPDPGPGEQGGDR